MGAVTDRLDSLLKFHPFTRLNALLEGVTPGGPPGGPTLAFSVGEPQAAPPDFLAPPDGRYRRRVIGARR